MLKIGHRGAPFAAFENTITSFRKALSYGADGIELDVHRCKSGELVVFHDVGVVRHTSSKGLIRDLTLPELKALALPGGEQISTLPEVLEALPKDIYYFVELKPADAVAPLVEMLRKYTARGWQHLILISFQHQALRFSPSFPIGATFDKGEPCGNKKAKAMGASVVLPYHAELTGADIEEAHQLGLKVVPWTVDEPADIARMHALGVDGIISDYPDRLNV
jgi:glycerophosphoryl diester phosphodiesterase